MRLVSVNSEKWQGAASVFRVRDLLIRLRIQAINALCGYLMEYSRAVRWLTTASVICPLIVTPLPETVGSGWHFFVAQTVPRTAF